jgi:DNA methylase/Methyltransferase domain
MSKCLCGCGQAVSQHAGAGRPGKYASTQCASKMRKRTQRQRVTENTSGDVTLINKILTGDCQELIKLVPDNSIDLIFTDPPYLKAYLPLYGWLGKEAARVLKPGGFCLAYTGVIHKWTVMQLLADHLDYFTDIIALDNGKQSSILWSQKLISRHKSILAFSKGPGLPRCQMLTSFFGGGKDKRFHKWGQDEQTARYYIDCFTLPGQVILDPFVGGGTTCYVAAQIGRGFIGFEIDGTQAEIARHRLLTMQMPLLTTQPDQMIMEEGA